MKYEDFNYDISNEEFMFNTKYTESTEALKDIVKKVAKKAADKAGILPAGNINVNKSNIKGFHQAARVLLNYGQSRELINRSFKGIDIKKFGSKSNLDAFMNSIKPVGKFHVSQGWLIFDLMETDTYKLKNDLNKEDWDNMYDAAEMVTKKANYTTIRIIKELFGSRGIELHPNPIGHLLSKNGTKSKLMFKLGKVKIEDGTFENSNDLVDRIRFTIGTESFDPELTYEDEYALEDVVESANFDYEFFEAIGIESEMIAIAETFGEIEDLNEMIAIESVEHNYLNSLEGLEAEIDTIINAIDNLEISLESFEEGTEGFKEVANEIVKQGRKLIKAILRYFNIGLSLHEQGLKTAEIIRKVSKKTISELKTLPKPAQEKFEFRTSFISMTQYYMNKVYSNNNKSFPLVGLAENINRVYNAQGRKFNEDNIVDFSKRFEELSQISVPQELADMAIVNTRMNYDQTLMSFGELLGIRGEHAARKCTGDVEAVINILKAEINNVEYSPKLVEALKNWLKGVQSVIKPYKTMLINLGRATKGLTKDIASAIRKSKAAVGVESVGFESSIKDTDTTQVIVNEILSRMEQDPILKLAKDKELIEIKANPKAKRKISINFKEIKEIEKILTPEDIQKYGGSTYQFLLKLSDTFNKNIMWNMKEIEETAKSEGNNLDAEAVESLKGRGYYIYKGIESLDDLIEEMIMMENGLEDFDELEDSAKAWIKKAIAVIMDFLSKDKVVYFFQVRNFQDIQKKVRALNEYNMDDYDLYVLGKISGLFSDLNKSKSYFYRKLKAMNFSDGSSIKTDLKGLKGVSNKVKTLTESIDNIYDLWKDKYKRNPNRESKKGAVGTVKSTILKMKFEYIDVRQNFLELEKKIEEGALSKTDEEALRAFLNLSKSMQSAYLKGATKAMKMIRKMLYDPQKKPSNENVEIELCCNGVVVDSYGLESAVSDQFKSLVKIAAIFTLGTTVIPLTLKALWNQTPWGKKKLEEKVRQEAEAQEKAKRDAENKLRIEKDLEETNEAYKEIAGKARKDIVKVSQAVHKMMPKMPEFKKFVDELEEKSKNDKYIQNFKSDILWFCSDDDYIEDYGDAISAFNFSQEVYLLNEWKNLSEALLREFNKQSNKIYCKSGYRWEFVEPFDDESCFWCVLEKIQSEGTEGLLDTIKQKWNNKVNEIKKDIENQKRLNKTLTLTEDQAKKLRDNAYKVAKEMYKDLKNETRKSGLKIELTQSNEFHNVIIVEYEDDDEYKWSINLATYYDEDTYGDAVHKYEEFPKIIDTVIDRHKSKLGYEIDGWETNNGEEIIIPMPKAINISTKGIESFDIGEEGILDTIKQKWKDGIEKQKARREKERKEREEAYKNKQKANNSSKIIKTLPSTTSLNKLQSDCIEVVKSIYDEVKSNVSKAKLNFIKLEPFDKDEAVNILDDYGDYQLEFHFLYYATPKWTKDNHDEVFEQEEKLWDIIESAINKYKDRFGVPIEYHGVDGNLSWGITDGYIRVSEDSASESQIVQAIYDEFGTEGITSIIKRITSSK